MQKISASQSVRPASPPMNLDVGRLDPHEATALGLLLIGALAVSAVGAFLTWSVVPTYYDMASWRFILALFGVLLAAAGLLFAGLVGFLMVDRWLTYRSWLRQWQEISLSTWADNGGQEVQTTFEGWQLLPTQPLHLVAAALSIHQEVIRGDSSFSINSLAGSRYVGGSGNNLVKLGDLSPNGARAVLNNLATMGLIRGRGPRSSGEWVPGSTDECVRLIADNFHKIQGG